MALRCTVAEIQDTLDTSLSVAQLLVCMGTASTLVDTYLASSTLSLALLKEIERYLSAHFVCIREPLFTEARSQGEGFTFQRAKAEGGLKETSYGRQALLLDSTGILEGLGTKRRVVIKLY